MRHRALKQVLLILMLLLTAGTGFAARLIVKTGVKGVEVWVDGNRVGFTDRFGNLIVGDVTEGKHSIMLQGAGIAPVKKTINVTALDNLINFVPNRVQSASHQTLPNLFVDGNVAGVQVFLNGALKGITGRDGRLALRVPPGDYTISFHLDGYRAPQPIVVRVGDIAKRVSFRMTSLKTAAHSGSGDWLPAVLIILLIVAILSATAFLVYLLFKGKKGNMFHGRYRLKGIIGRGGMATIYKAKDIRTGETVVLKIMDPGLLSDADLLKKFLREGEVIRKLNEEFPDAPVVKVYEYGRENGSTHGRPFIVMEYLKGRDLLLYLKQAGKLSVHQAETVIIQVSRALKAAHAIGVYHRDLTPDNIILVRDGESPEIRLIDFGVARHEYTSAGTLDGSITGKPPYMSPEQCRGMKVDSRSDIYSLGVVFYTLLTGHPPFVSPNPLEVMKKHESEPVPALPESIPAGVAMVIYKMLEKDPGSRYRSADQVIQVLGNLKGGLSQ